MFKIEDGNGDKRIIELGKCRKIGKRKGKEIKRREDVLRIRSGWVMIIGILREIEKKEWKKIIVNKVGEREDKKRINEDSGIFEIKFIERRKVRKDWSDGVIERNGNNVGFEIEKELNSEKIENKKVDSRKKEDSERNRRMGKDKERREKKSWRKMWKKEERWFKERDFSLNDEIINKKLVKNWRKEKKGKFKKNKMEKIS